MINYTKKIINLKKYNNFVNKNSALDKILEENKKKRKEIQKITEENDKKMIYLESLEQANKELKSAYEEVKIKNLEYNQSLQNIFKILHVLNENGLDVKGIMDSISPGEDYCEYDELTEESNRINKGNDSKITNNSMRSSVINNSSTGILMCHDEFLGSKLNTNFKNKVPILNLAKVEYKED